MCPPRCDELCILTRLHWPAPDEGLVAVFMGVVLGAVGGCAALGAAELGRALLRPLRSTSEAVPERVPSGALARLETPELMRATWFLALGLSLWPALIAALSAFLWCFARNRCGSGHDTLSFAVSGAVVAAGVVVPWALHRAALRRLRRRVVASADGVSEAGYRAPAPREARFADPSAARRAVMRSFMRRVCLAAACSCALAALGTFTVSWLPPAVDLLCFCAASAVVLACHFPGRRSLRDALDPRCAPRRDRAVTRPERGAAR